MQLYGKSGYKRVYLFVLALIMVLSSCQFSIRNEESENFEYKTALDFYYSELPQGSSSSVTSLRAVFANNDVKVNAINTYNSISNALSVAKDNGFNCIVADFNPYELYFSDMYYSKPGQAKIIPENAKLINDIISQANDLGINVFLKVDAFLVSDGSFGFENLNYINKNDLAINEKRYLNICKYSNILIMSDIFSRMSSDIKAQGYILSELDFPQIPECEKECLLTETSADEYVKKALENATVNAISSILNVSPGIPVMLDYEATVYADYDALLQKKLFNSVFCNKEDAQTLDDDIDFVLKQEIKGEVYDVAEEYKSSLSLEKCFGTVFYDSKVLAHNENYLLALKLEFEGQIDDETKGIELEISTPKNNITVERENIVISGSCDNNFPLYMNGEKIEPSEKGLFSVDYKLNKGKNVIEFSHKDKTVTLNVTYYLRIIKDLSLVNNITVSSGATVAMSVYARSGAKVSGVLNGKTIAFTQKNVAEDDDSENADNDFALFEAVFAVEQNNSEKTKNLGSCRVTASYNGFTESLVSGKIFVESIFNNTEGQNMIVETTAERAETFDNDMAQSVIDKALPINIYLPKGTKDYVIGEITYFDDGEDLSYWKMKSGKRVYKKDSKTYVSSEKLYGEISSVSVVDNGKYTDIIMNTPARPPFEIDFNVSYKAFNKKAGYFDFTCNFNPSTISFLLHNVNFDGGINVSQNPVLSNVSMSNVSSNSCRLTLNLKNAGRFYGFTSKYDEQGRLCIRLINPTVYNESTGKFSEGFTVLVDAGHGGKDPGAKGVGGVWEQTLNLRVAQELVNKFKQAGATVYTSRTTNNEYNKDKIFDIIEKQQPTLLISIHHNASTSSAVYGPEVYYYYPFSQGIAEKVLTAIGRTHSAGWRSKYKALYSLRSHEGMRILVECAYITNVKDYQFAVDNSAYFSEKIFTAVKEYYS
ncbi:MAG: N-acetylmuramoyl-L-alanine amidase [Ruminococcaceae bacterium]|nr:N-acetylmuramoyl-L-alanine amidase [Oscillospiraceae bacterium]